MRILYFYQYFSTPKGSWGTRAFDFAKNWVTQGHEVTVVTAIYAKSDLSAAKYLETQVFEGVRVKVVKVHMDNRQSLPKRVWTFVQFSLVASYYAFILPCDLVIASSGPLSIGIPGLVGRFLRGKKLVFEVRDLWPQGAIELGIIRNPLLKWMARRFEALCYKSSDLVVALSPGMKDDIKQRFGNCNIISVTNGADIDLFGTIKHPNSSNLYGDYAIYTGNIGDVNDSLGLLDTARILNEMGRNDIKILLIGDGQQRKMIDNAISNEKLTNIIRLDLMPKTELVGLIQNAVVSLVPLKGTPVLKHSSPNKFFESLAAGIPVVQTTDGWIKTFLEEHNIGFTISPSDPRELAELLVHLFDNREKVKKMGARAKEVAKKYFDKELLSTRMLQTIETIP